ALVERPHGHPPEEAFRGRVVASRGQGPGLFDVPLKRQGLDARLFRILEDRVRVLQGVRHAALPTDDVEGPSGCAGQVQRPAEVPGGLRLFCSFEEAAREGDVHLVLWRGEEILMRACDCSRDRTELLQSRASSGERLTPAY